MRLMNCFTRRALGVGLGLCIGWYVAGLIGFANASAERGEGPTHASIPDDHGSAHGGHANPALELKLDANASIGVTPIRNGIIALFVAAILLGIPTLKLRGTDPPDPEEHLAHGHDGHKSGHDEH